MCVCTFKRVCVYVQYIQKYVYIKIRAYIYIYINNVYVCVCVYVCMYVCMYVHVCKYLNIYTYMYIFDMYICMYMYEYVWICMCIYIYISTPWYLGVSGNRGYPRSYGHFCREKTVVHLWIWGQPIFGQTHILRKCLVVGDRFMSIPWKYEGQASETRHFSGWN
jgi:hypothetical protein